MVNLPASGYKEIAHTADWALHVWGPDFNSLVATAAKGMYSLMDIEGIEEPRTRHAVEVNGPDDESLLVMFLNELLFLLEQKRQVYDQIELNLAPNKLIARLEGAPITRQSKEIKAATFHNINIESTLNGLEVTIVFDV